jgi:hypothetical protein
MKQVIRYECPFCKKIFKTPDRHSCKHNPAHRNCLTCGKLEKFDIDEGQFDCEGRCEIAPSIMPECSYRYTQEFDDVFEDAIDESRRRNRGYGYSYDYAYGLLDVMHHNKWKLDCPGWIAKEAAHETV